MFVIGYPKSGNAWINFVLAYCLNTDFDDYQAPGIHPRRESIRMFVKGGLAHKSYKSIYGQILKTHEIATSRLLQEPYNVYLMRDCRDVVVSYFFYLNNVVKKKISFKELIQKVPEEWSEHIFKYMPHCQVIVKYEEMQENFNGRLDQLFSDMGIDVSGQTIDEARRIFSFENLSGGRKKGKEDPNNFFRKGIIGDWKQYLDIEDKKIVKAKIGKLLIEHGYETSMKW